MLYDILLSQIGGDVAVNRLSLNHSLNHSVFEMTADYQISARGREFVKILGVPVTKFTGTPSP